MGFAPIFFRLNPGFTEVNINGETPFISVYHRVVCCRAGVTQSVISNTYLNSTAVCTIFFGNVVFRFLLLEVVHDCIGGSGCV